MLEVLIAVFILLMTLSWVIPNFQRNSRVRAAQSGARVLEAALRERKERALALGMDAGLCISDTNSVRFYEIHPFLSSSSITKTVDFNRVFGVPVSISVSPSGSFKSPCISTEADIRQTPQVNPIKDWQGTILLQAGLDKWRLVAKPGELYDIP